MPKPPRTHQPAHTIASFLIFCFFCIADVQAQQEVDLLITGGHVFETESGEFVPNTCIAVLEGRFLNVGASATEYRSAEELRLSENQYVLPGLVDCHAHYNVRLIRKRREEFEVMPVVYLANGSTVTFSCGEFDPEAMLALRKRIESGEQIGPRLITSGPYFGRARPSWRGIPEQQQIFDEVDFWVEQGTGGFKAKAIDPESLQHLITRAHHHGLTVTGHLDSGYRGSVNPGDAIEMGIDRVEHFLGGDAMPDSRSAYASLGDITADMPEYKAIVEKYLENDVVFDATLTAYGYFGSPREEFEYWYDERSLFTPHMQQVVLDRPDKEPMAVFEKIYLAKQQTIGAFFEAGGTISMGTDHVSDGNHLPGFGAHRELDAFVRNGIPEADAIRIGTINGARALGIEDDHGSIEEGKVADLFIIEGSPLENIRSTRNIETVIRAGVVYDSAQLLESVSGKLGPASREEESDW
ncbi:MAG: amidohydrolase family protein [Planctomycetota bacterium]